MQTPSSTPYLDNAYSRRGLSKFAMLRGVGQGAANAAKSTAKSVKPAVKNTKNIDRVRMKQDMIRHTREAERAGAAGRGKTTGSRPSPRAASPKPNPRPAASPQSNAPQQFTIPSPTLSRTAAPALSNHPRSVKPQPIPKPQAHSSNIYAKKNDDAVKSFMGDRPAATPAAAPAVAPSQYARTADEVGRQAQWARNGILGGTAGLGLLGANELLNSESGSVEAPVISDATTSGESPMSGGGIPETQPATPSSTPVAEDVSVSDLLSDLGPQQSGGLEDNPSMRNYNQQQVDQASEMAAAREEAGMRMPTLAERSEQNAVNRDLEAGFERPTPQGFSSIGQAGQFNGLPEEIAGLPRRPFRMHSGQDLNAPPIGMSPSSPAEPTEDMLAAFQKFHATPFDPRSSMDRAKMAELQALVDGGKSLTAANVYGNAMKAASNVLRFPRLTDLMYKEAGLGGALLGAGAGGALTDVAAPAVAEKIADLLHFIKHKGNTDDGSNSLKHVSRMIGGTTQNAYRDRAQDFLDKYSPAVTGAGALLGGLTGNAIQDRNEEEDEWTSYPAKRASVAMAMADLVMLTQYAA